MSGYPKFYIVNIPIDEAPVNGTFSHSEIWVEIESASGVQLIRYAGYGAGNQFPGVIENPEDSTYGRLIIQKTITDTNITPSQVTAFDITEINVEESRRQDFLDSLEQSFRSAGTIEQDNPGLVLVNTNIEYDPIRPNSNSITNTLLDLAGADFRKNLPHIDGDIEKSSVDLYRFQGSDTFVDSQNGANYKIFSSHDALYFYKFDGVDTLYMEKGAELEVRGVEETDGLTKIVLKDVRYSEVGFSEDDGELSVTDNSDWNPLSDDIVRLPEYANYKGYNNIEFVFSDGVYRIGTSSDDQIDVSAGLKPVSFHLDGLNGEDTFTGKLSGFYDETTKSYYEGGGVVKLENFEKIEGTVILADVHNARTLEGRVLTSEQDTDGPHYSFKASDVGAVVNLTVDAGYTETLESGHYSYHIIRNIEASYNFGGSVWNGNILDLDTTFVSSAYSHASNFWQVVSGTNKGDTFNVNMDTSNQDGLVTRLAIETGTGNDTINFSQGNYSSFALGYTGGNDVVHNAGALVNIYLEGFSSENVNVTGIAISDGYVTGYKILFDAGNSITLDGLHIDATGGTILNFPISGLSVTTAGAITTGAAVIDGAYIGHEPTFYGKSVWNGGESGETYFAGAGNNTVSGNGGDDNLDGQQGNDTLDGGSGNNILSGGAGDDTLKSFQGVSRLYGGDGSDTYIISSSSTSYIDDRDPDIVDWHSQNGSNTLVIKNLNFDELDFVIGASGTLNIIDDKGVSFANLADYRHFSLFKFGEGNVSISLNDLLDRTAENVEKLYCTQEVDSIIAPFRTDGVTSKYSLGGGDDEFTGSSGREIVLGESGDDHISGEGGNDNLLGGDGNDRLLGGVGDDELYGGSGEDYLQGGQGNDVINGGDDVDLVGYLDFENLSGVGVNVDLAAGLASNDGYGTV